jgi:hypothetical protein
VSEDSMKEITFRLKDVLAAVGWKELVSWRAKELLSHYRKLLNHFGARYVLPNSLKLARLRRNRALVKAVGKGFADYIQVEFDFTCNTKVEHLPEYYEPSSWQPYRFREFKPRNIFFSDAALKEVPHAIAGRDYDEYEVLPTKFGDMKGNRMVAGYLAEKDTVYISKKWKQS